MSRNTTFPGLQNQATRDQAEQAIFGRTIPDDLYGDLIGDIARNADVEVTYNDYVPSKNKNYRIKMRAEQCLFSSTIRMNPGELDYSECTMKLAGTGIARLILHLSLPPHMLMDSPLWSQLAQFPATAVTRATNGYYTYTKYGFDEAIPAAVLALITPQQNAALQGRVRVLDLMADDVGRTFWKANGVQLNNMVFDLTPGSISWQRLCTLPSP